MSSGTGEFASCGEFVAGVPRQSTTRHAGRGAPLRPPSLCGDVYILVG
ncbi:hypothetical protein [Nocardia anaemiae]|nr:hypothetical protein [Nocardia anaemiae]